MKGAYIIALAGCIFFSFHGLAQKNSDAVINTAKNTCCIYEKLDDYKIFLDDVAKRNAEKLDKKLRKEYTEVITEKNTGLLTELKENNFLFDSVITKYLSSVFYYILDRNGFDKNAFHFFVSRSAEVNASAYEDGTIICNLGLLNIAETESQVAMAFCHELAHYLLDHVNRSIISSIERFNSPELIARVKEIKKEKYNTKKQLEELLVTDLFSRRRHNRTQELAADSLGMILLSKTSYGSAAIPHIFNLLDSSENGVTKCTIQSFFKKENIASDDSWFTIQKKISFGTAPKKEIADTLKTHPDCAKRKLYAQDFFAKNPKPGADFIMSAKDRFYFIKDQSLYAQANYAKDNERLGFYLYQLIQNDARFAADKNIKTEILSTWVSFYFKLKNHTLGYVIDKPYPTENEKDEYAKLLRVFDAVDLKKLKEIALGYYEKNKSLVVLNDRLNTDLLNLKQQ